MRWTLPRYRYDQLMRVRLEGPAAGRVVNLLVTAAGVLVLRAVMTLFYVFARCRHRVASLLVIAQRNPIYSVLLLIASFGALSGLYVLLDAPFVAVIQIIVYAGAIMVLFLFVVMLLNAPHEETEHDARAAPADAAAARCGSARCWRWRSSPSSVWALTRGRRCGRVRRPLGELGRGHRPACCSPTTRSRSK